MSKPRTDVKDDDDTLCYRYELEAAVKAEREACAKLCGDWPNGRDDVYSIGVAIRARGQA